MKTGVIVTGLPASGKTTLARTLAKTLGFAFLDKDDFLEDLYDQFEVRTWEDRTRLSRQSDQLFQDAARRSGSAVLVSHWRPLNSPDDSGTPSDWVVDDYDRLVEVCCICAPDVALARFLARSRHPDHQDDQRDVPDLKKRMCAWENRFPIGVGSLIKVEADATVDTDAVRCSIQTVLAGT